MIYKIDTPSGKVQVKTKETSYYDHIAGRKAKYCIASFRIGKKVYYVGGEKEKDAYGSAVSSLLVSSTR